MGARLLLQSYQYSNLLEGADRVGGQLSGDKKYPFSGVNKSGRVWRKVPKSDARSVLLGVRFFVRADNYATERAKWACLHGDQVCVSKTVQRKEVAVTIQ